MAPLIFILLFIIIYISILKRPFKLSEGVIALIGAGLVILLGFVTPKGAIDAFIGTYSHPWQSIIFLITFAIISTTLDDLGFFKWCAIKATVWARHDGVRLFNYLFMATAIITFVTANDIVILTLTPFILHLGMHHNKHPKAYLIMMFIVANTGSIGLLFGNLTNLIVGDVFNIGFVEFSKYMMLPMIAAFIVEYLILRKIFWKDISQKFDVDTNIDARSAIKDWNRLYAVITVFILVIFLAIIQPLHHIELWILTTAGAMMTMIIGGFTIKERMIRIPWPVILFVASLFIIIAGFKSTGISSYLANLLSHAQNMPLIILAIAAVMATSLIAAFMNNIPGTILMTNVLAQSSLTGLPLVVTSYAVVIGSNLGANITIIGALAGLMWIHLIREKGYQIDALEFSKIGIITMIPTILAISVTLFLEMILF